MTVDVIDLSRGSSEEKTLERAMAASLRVRSRRHAERRRGAFSSDGVSLDLPLSLLYSALTFMPPDRNHGSACTETVPAFAGALARVVDLGAGSSIGDAQALIRCRDRDLPTLLEAAGRLRDRHKGRLVTYSRKVFLPITNLCRDRCSYCTFRKDPDDPGAWTMQREEIRAWLGRARAQGCKEALMCLGDTPETAFPSHRATLAGLGHESTIDYVHEACEMALAAGLLPHTNAGVLSGEEMRRLRPVNVSLGLMLESASPRLRARGMPHHHAPDKEPARRLAMIAEAGRLRIPFTTGILLGIGETPEERVDALFAIADLHRTHGHIQEVIVQNFRAKDGIPMAGTPEPTAGDMARAIAVARLLLGGDMNLQAPPNLSPDDHRLLLRAGINDWGGISPVSRDYVNPEAAWPQIAALAATCHTEGFTLRERLAIYPEYARPDFLDPSLATPVGCLTNRIAQEDVHAVAPN